MVLRGGYVLQEASGKRDATLIATGTEVAIACAAADLLKEQYALHVAVVSMPCQELFDQQDAAWEELEGLFLSIFQMKMSRTV